MTETPDEKPKGQKGNGILWRYIGENPPENKGILYSVLTSPYKTSGDEWQQPNGKEVFLMTIRDDLQPPPFRHRFEGSNAGYLWAGSTSDFKKEFERVGAKK